MHHAVIAMQVPLDLGRAVASATDQSALRSYAAFSALDALFNKAVADGVLASRVSASGSQHSLARSIGNQLQQSGFITALPLQLDAAATALKAAQHAAVPAHVLQHCIFLQNAADAAAAATATSLVRTQQAAANLLQLTCIALVTWPHQVDKGTVSLPALHTCAAAQQHCSRLADLASADAPAPVAVGELMITACSTVQAVCAAWRQQGQELNRTAFAASVGSPEALQAISTLLLACTLCPSSLFDNTTETSSSSAASNSMRVVKVLEANTSASARQAAWQYACTHQSELSELQHQGLHMLGYSGRALMYASQEGLSPIVSPLTVGLACHSLSRLAQHCPLCLSWLS